MSHLQILNGECKIFDGSSRYQRMNAVMKDIVCEEENCKEFSKLGLGSLGRVFWDTFTLEELTQPWIVQAYQWTTHCIYLYPCQLEDVRGDE